MKIGIDFDNTIVDYDRVFHQTARQHGLIPANLPARKDAVRNHLRQSGREADWTRLQGTVYGKEIGSAPPFPGVIDFFRQSAGAGIEVCIISHRTRFPIRGPRFPLHQAAREWLTTHGLVGGENACLAEANVFFEETRQSKLERIAQTGCTYFVDDLPEFLDDAGFPKGVAKFLFDPHGQSRDSDQWQRAKSWRQLTEVLIDVQP